MLNDIGTNIDNKRVNYGISATKVRISGSVHCFEHLNICILSEICRHK